MILFETYFSHHNSEKNIELFEQNLKQTYNLASTLANCDSPMKDLNIDVLISEHGLTCTQKNGITYANGKKEKRRRKETGVTYLQSMPEKKNTYTNKTITNS